MPDFSLPERRPYYVLLGLAVMLAVALGTLAPSAPAQPADEEAAGPAPALPATGGAGEQPLQPARPADANRADDGIKFFWLLVSGGWLMLPILLMSLLTVTFTIERFIGLRRSKVIPQELFLKLGELGSQPGGFDPRQAYRLCQEFPSAASNVIRAMLLKVGRPHSEVEHAVNEASEREADRIYSNVRWLNLAAVVTPLMGLLGTVWGMIVAFHDTTQLAPGQNKANFLAEGIYVALVTTLGGLAVAIPAAILAHYFEGRITQLFHQIDELLFNLLPQVERYEGRVRFSQRGGEEPARPLPPAEAPPATSRPGATHPSASNAR